ncbi:hypothetical protein Dimus_001089, partial [Dionaea muscipula]
FMFLAPDFFSAWPVPSLSICGASSMTSPSICCPPTTTVCGAEPCPVTFSVIGRVAP